VLKSVAGAARSSPGKRTNKEWRLPSLLPKGEEEQRTGAFPLKKCRIIFENSDRFDVFN
jgi:hypothetical protein